MNVDIQMRDLHTFGCPVFALDNALDAGHKIPKWSPHFGIGVHIGPSLHHARNVYLVLNVTTDLVSPQSHVQFDDFFEITRDIGSLTNWKHQTGLMEVTPVDTANNEPIIIFCNTSI